MASATIFKGFNNPLENKSLIILTKEIKEGKYKEEVQKVTALVSEGKKEEADKLKKQLLAFTPSATFDGGRKLEYLTHYSGYIILDLDKLMPDALQLAFEKATAIPYTFCCFRSPSGNGVKIPIEINSAQEHHEQAYKQLADYYEQQIGLPVDRSGKDITRLCFVSYDPQAYRNIQNEKFTVVIDGAAQTTQPKPSQQIVAQPEMQNQYDLAFEMQIAFTNQKAQYEPNNRNNYIYLLGSNCNRAGIPEQDTTLLCNHRFDLDGKEIAAAVKSAYQHHTAEFAKFANVANLAKVQTPKPEEEDKTEDYLKTTPIIPDEVFSALPQILQDGAAAFPDQRKRDVFFTGAIAILSGCLPKVTGVYFQERVYPHIFTFIIAPAGNGKGVLKNAKRLASKYDDKIIAQSRQEQKVYEAEMAEYKREASARGKKETLGEKPEAPPFKLLFIPANCSTSRMLEHLQQNGGSGIICETEADTMSGAKKQDWGDYSPILRAAFHSEEISLSRKTNNELIKIPEPRLAITLTGTPAQAPRLIGSSEDGLFSRFLFYAFKSEHVWQDPSPKSQSIVHNDHFEALSVQVLNMIEFLENSPTDVQLYPHQWDILNTTFTNILADVTTFTSEDASGVVYRLGLIQFRFCMIFTALRKFENGEVVDSLFCTDEDFNTAQTIIKTYLQHSLLMYNNLPGQADAMQFKPGDGKRKFIDALPQNFSRKEAVEIGKQFQLGASTVSHLLPKLVPSLFTQPKTGFYCRI